MARVLVVDDDPLVRRAMAQALSSEHEVTTAEDVASAERCLGEEVFHLLITDVRMPGKNGVDLVRQLREELPDLPVIAASGHQVVGEFAELLSLGVADYLRKPFRPAELRLAAARALQLRELHREMAALVAARSSRVATRTLLGRSRPMLDVLDRIDRVAPTDTTVLIIGSTGTGKELVARSIHDASERRKGPFVAVNCGAINAGLAETTLFGHAKGAFTGATEARPGCFETACGGTLFLDEIGTMSTSLQVKLLRVLSSGESQRIGETKQRPLDLRVLAATNIDLAEAVEEGRFREDLYHRLAVFPIRLPDLAARGRADLELLCEHLVEKTCHRMGRPLKSLSPEALERLEGHSWPGNVRELENALERAILLTGDEAVIGPTHVILRARPAKESAKRALPDGGFDMRDYLSKAEAALIEQALTRSEGKRSGAAALLGLPPSTLADKIRAIHSDQLPPPASEASPGSPQ